MAALNWDEFGPIEARSFQAITDHLPGGRSQFMITRRESAPGWFLFDFGVTSPRWSSHGAYKTSASAKKQAEKFMKEYPVMKNNPAPKRKTSARTQSAAEAYVRRPSQITKKAPSDRLKKRRTVNLQSPRGVFPNPSNRPYKARFPDAKNFTLGAIARIEIDDDNSLAITKEYGAFIARGWLNGKHFVDSFRTYSEAKKFFNLFGLKKNPDSVHFDIDVNSHNAKGSKARTRVNPVTRHKAPAGKEKFIMVQLKYGKEWEILSLFPKTPEGAENAIMYAKAYHVKEPKSTIRVIE